MHKNFFNFKSKNIFNSLSIFLFILKINLLFCKSCKGITDLTDIGCFNSVIMFNHQHYRAGHGATNDNGDTIFEFSVDDVYSKRLFYGLKKNGRYYFPGEPVFKEFDITDKNDTSNSNNLGRLESYNLFVHTQNEDEQNKQYLFSISSYESLVELHDIESGEYQTVQTKKFYNERRIFSYQYSIFEIGNSSTFILAAVVSCGERENGKGQTKEYSDTNIIKKFQFNGFNSNNMYKELASKISPNNNNVRVISSIRIDPAEVICLLFIDSDGKLVIDFYNDTLVYQNKKYTICTLSNLDKVDGFGFFVKLLYLRDIYAVLAYFTDYYTTSSFKFRIVKYNDYNFTDILTRDFSDFKFLVGLGYNGLFKLDENRLVLASVKCEELTDGRHLYFFVIDLYENYTKIKMRRFNFINFFIPKNIIINSQI